MTVSCELSHHIVLVHSGKMQSCWWTNVAATGVVCQKMHLKSLTVRHWSSLILKDSAIGCESHLPTESLMKHSVRFPHAVTVAISILTKILACWRQRLSPLDSKRTQHVTMKWLCQLKGWEKKQIHTGLTSMALPPNSQWSTLVSFPYKKTIKIQIKAATVIEEPGLQRLFYSRWGGTVRKRKKKEKQGEIREDEPSVCHGSAWTLVSHRIHLCSFVGAKYNSMGLLTFQYFSLTSSREKEPFRTCAGKRETVILKKCTYDMFIKIGVKWYS